MSDNQSAAVLLYVEDEMLIHDIVESALQDAGFEIVIAANGAEALDMLHEKIGTIRGLITDVNLGEGPDGWDVARRARELIQGLPVIYVSGASEHQWMSKGVPHSVMISKPFAPAQIVVAVSSLLNTTDGA